MADRYMCRSSVVVTCSISVPPSLPSFLLQVELEPELVLLQLSLERQQAADVEELQRCIDEVQSHCTYLPTYLSHLIHRVGVCLLLLL